MYSALPQSQQLATKLLSAEQLNVIQFSLDEIRKNPTNYAIDAYWEIDSKIGGIGGYCLPKHPSYKPFPVGINGQIYRTLQYASSWIKYRELNRTARNTVIECGMHLESVMRLFLKEHYFLGSLRFHNTTLGKAVEKAKSVGILDMDTLDGLQLFVSVYNKSKHEINFDVNRERLFAPADALILYLVTRVLGRRVLAEVSERGGIA